MVTFESTLGQVVEVLHVAEGKDKLLWLKFYAFDVVYKSHYRQITSWNLFYFIVIFDCGTTT